MLNVMKYDNGKFIGSGEIDAGGTFPFKRPWIVHDRKIITYDSAANKLLCHDADLKSSTHPFVEIFNRNSSNFRKLKEMIIHPTLPFGLVVEIGKDLDWEKIFAMPLNDETDKIKRALYKQQEIHALYLLRWDITDTKKQYIPLHTDTLSFFHLWLLSSMAVFPFHLMANGLFSVMRTWPQINTVISALAVDGSHFLSLFRLTKTIPSFLVNRYLWEEPLINIMMLLQQHGLQIPYHLLQQMGNACTNGISVNCKKQGQLPHQTHCSRWSNRN